MDGVDGEARSRRGEGSHAERGEIVTSLRVYEFRCLSVYVLGSWRDKKLQVTRGKGKEKECRMGNVGRIGQIRQIGGGGRKLQVTSYELKC